MTAIHLPRLRIQAAELVTFSHQPEKFTSRLVDLLDFYADRTLRPSRRGRLPTLLPTHQVPAPVLRQIEGELDRALDKDTPAALALADTLWAQVSFECRQLAIHLLQRANPNPPEPVLERYKAWAQTDVDPALLDLLLAQQPAHLYPSRTRLQGRLLSESPDLWLGLIDAWINNSAPGMQGMGLRALLSLANDPDFENLPVIYKLAGTLLHNLPAVLLPDMAALIESLTHRSPAETGFFLRQALGAGREPTLVRLVRRCLPAFPEAQQMSLQKHLISHG